MHELGNVQHAAQGTRALTPPRNELPDPTQKTAKIKIADDDAAAAVFESRHSIDILPTSENSTFSIYSESSEYVKWLGNEIKEINAYDGFLLGIHDKIEKFKKHTQFTLEQILDVEEYKAKLYENLELYKFTLIRIRAEALKALRCQGNLGPRRVLRLLKETIGRRDTVGKSTEQQTAKKSEYNE